MSTHISRKIAVLANSAHALQNTKPAKPATPADVLKNFGLDPWQATQECAGLEQFLAGRAPEVGYVNGMLRWLSNRPNFSAENAAALMVAIQEFHPQFIPQLDVDDSKSTFYKNCFKVAATVSGLKICALWTESSAAFVGELLEHPNCSICTLDFSQLDTRSRTTARCWNESAFKKNSSVKTWQRLSPGWPGLNFIGDHVHALKLRIVADDVFSEADSKKLQLILARGNIDSVRLEAMASTKHLLLAQAVQGASCNGGRVHEVHLLGCERMDNRSTPQILQLLCGSKSVITVTLPGAWWLDRVALKTLKDWLKMSSVGYLDFAIVPVKTDEAAHHLVRMAELTPLLVRNRQLVAAHIMSTGAAFSMQMCKGMDIEALTISFQTNLSPHECENVRKVLDKGHRPLAGELTRERQARINGSELRPHAPASNTSPGAKIDGLQNADCRLAELGLWLAQGLKENSVEPKDRNDLENALRVKLATAVDAAFDDAAARQNQPQIIADRDKAGRIVNELFGPSSTPIFASLPHELSSALGGVVPREDREKFKSFLLDFMSEEILRAFDKTVVAW